MQQQNILNFEVLFFKNELTCGVCKVLSEKVENLISSKFPEIIFTKIDVVSEPQTAADNGVFSVPTIIIKIDGKEYVRNVGNMSIHELESVINRYYNLIIN